jgi:TnpA family transposase
LIAASTTPIPAGAIDHVFGLCHLLGIRFAPRIRDLADRRLYVLDARAAYKALAPLIAGTLDLRGVGDNWDEVLRMTASIKAGTIAPSAILRRLAAYPRQNALAKMLKEIGRLEAERSTAFDPNVARLQPLARRHHDRDLAHIVHARLDRRPRLASSGERRPQ